MDADNYRAWLLRLWRAEDGTWRASLEHPRTGERLGFDRPDALWAFLEHHLNPAPAPSPMAVSAAEPGASRCAGRH